MAIAPVTLVLVGAVGSGKSTFSQALVQNSRTVWRRVNQDSLKSRQRCEKAAKQTLASSDCVIIDRMNFDAEQRAHWVKLASAFSSPCYVLCLKYPAEVCATRGSQRIQHEGGVVGDQASKLAFMMSKSISENMPAVAEGFEHVITVTNDEEAAIVLKAWQDFNPQEHTDPSLVLTDIRSKLPRSAFICKGDTPFTLAGTKRDFMGCPVPQAHSRPLPPAPPTKPTHLPRYHKVQASGVHPGAHKAGTGAAQQQQHQAVRTASRYSCAQQTSGMATANQQQHQQQGTISWPLSAKQQQTDQPSESPNHRLLPSSLAGTATSQMGAAQINTQDAVRASDPMPSAAAHCSPPKPQQVGPWVTAVGREKRRLPASLLPGADMNNSPQKPTHGAGSRTTAQEAGSMRSAAPPQLATGQQDAKPAAPQSVVPSSPPLSDDVEVVGDSTHNGPSSSGQHRDAQTTPSKPPQSNAFSMMMAAARSPSAPSARTPEKKANSSKTNATSRGMASSSSAAGAAGAGAHTGQQVKSAFGWRQGRSSAWHDVFIPFVQEPEKHVHTRDFIWHDDRVVLLNDAYPKAKFHILVIARESTLLDLSCLRTCHIPLLEYMRSKADDWFLDKMDEVGYCLGFHWKPSVKQLHLHAISRDYDSPCLKQPKHYRSFCTDFFRDIDSVIGELKQRGSVNIDMQSINDLMKAPLRCLWCNDVMQNLPATKRHIGTCQRNPTVETMRPSRQIVM